MKNEQKALARLAHNIYAARDNDIQCNQAAIKMTRSADAMYSEEESRREFPELWRHFEVCSDCAEEYKALMEVATLEAEGKLEEPEWNLSFFSKGQFTGWELAQNAITTFFSGFTQSTSPVLKPARGFQMNLRPVITTLANERIRIELEVKVNEKDMKLLDLFCRISTDDPVIEAQLEDSPIWLQPENLGPATQIQPLDDLGDALFSAVEPGKYLIRLELAGQEYAIQGVELPQSNMR